MSDHTLYWCPKCQEAREVWMNKLVPIRETNPPYQYRFESVPTCGEGHRMVALCSTCEDAPAIEGFDDCLVCIPEDERPMEARRDQVQQVKPLVKQATFCSQCGAEDPMHFYDCLSAAANRNATGAA